nr:nitroreductase [Paenibacillus pasadenensis]
MIKERRTIRNFNGETLAYETILELLETAVWAPNHQLREPWRFIYIRPEKKRAMVECKMEIIGETTRLRNASPEQTKRFMEKGEQVPGYLAVVMPEDARQRQREDDYAAVCCLIQNLQLAAWDREIGVLWGTEEYLHHPKFRRFLGVTPGEKVVGLLYMGYFDQAPKPSERISAEHKMTVI